MIPADLQKVIESELSGQLGDSIRIDQTSAVGGGCIHNAQQLKTSKGIFFLKWNMLESLHNFDCESKGLKILEEANALTVPEVISTGSNTSHSFLLLDWIETGIRANDFWESFGNGLAELHRKTQTTFGLGHDNYIGALPQYNNACKSWSEFFCSRRLEPQLKIAMSKNLMELAEARKFLKLMDRISKLIPEEAPALLHGDLWSGNFMTGPSGKPVIVDPAVFYGHREAEIAFSRMFGGFDERFYEAYDSSFPLKAEWESRISIFNLYPLMVHLNLFGRSYLPEIIKVLDRHVELS